MEMEWTEIMVFTLAVIGSITVVYWATIIGVCCLPILGLIKAIAMAAYAAILILVKSLAALSRWIGRAVVWTIGSIASRVRS